MRRASLLTLVASAVVSFAAMARADDTPSSAPAKPQGDKQDESSLTKEAQNPIANLISIPFQLNLNGGVGAYDRTQMLLNIQPVVPLELNKTFTLITRWILPVLEQPDAAQPSGSVWGLGDFNPQIYLAIQLPGGFMLGPGITIVTPTATDTQLGLGKLYLGPSLVGVWIGGPMVVGVLINDAASVAGNDMRDSVHQMLLQPFINVNLPKGTSIVTSPIMIFDWVHSTYLVPLGGGIGQLIKLGTVPTNFSVQAFWNASKPPGGPDWTVRFQVQFLFPTKAAH
jgi:hypothetical protein